MSGKLFQNPGRVVIGIIVFVAALIALFSVISRADAHENRQTLTLEAGRAVIRGETDVLGFTVACKLCGPAGTDYEYGFELIGQSEFYNKNPNVIQLHAQIVDGWRRFEMGLGFYAMNNRQEYVCPFGFHLLARWRFTERIALQWRHSSSAGSCRPNAGRDLLTAGWRF